MEENKPQKAWWQPALAIFGEVTGWIVVPIICALFLGKYLDEKKGTEPWYFLGLTGVAFIISCIGITIIAGKYIKQIEKENKKKLNQNSNNEQRDRNNRDSE
ncbi:MAG: AtpZ/AtpI family protein [Patescibacteria group bacterium]|jgi:F0F1-type ATP synthase assembly protein I